MSHVIKFKRGTTANVAAYTPEAGEPVFDLSRKELRIGDGTQMGGFIMSRSVVVDAQTIDTGETVVDSFADTDAKGAIWHYTVDNGDGANMRTGRVQACWDRAEDGSVGQSPEEYGSEIGDTAGVFFAVEKSGNTIQLVCTVPSDDWAIDLVRVMIG
jgi:hypothetical protein